MYDGVIANGTIVDGSGAEPFQGDVAVTGDTIVAIGDLTGAESRWRVEARGKIVCPGFIDTHSHGDAFLLLEPDAPSKTHQGIATDIVGNCGTSAAPVTEIEHLSSDWSDKPYPGTWRTVAEYRTLLETVKPAPNVALLAGHNTLRRCAGAYDNRPPTADEMACMIRMLDQAMDEGARGLSTGLIYPPGRFSRTDEIVALAKAAARKNGLYASHMRSEGAGLIEAIEEALTVGEEAGISVQISHLKTGGRDNWTKIGAALDRIESARARGRNVHADRYPYIASHTSLSVVLPDWALEGTVETRLARLTDPEQRRRLEADLLIENEDRRWDAITVGSTHHPDNLRFQGQPLLAIAKELRLDPAATVLHFAQTDAMRTSAFFAEMCEENMFTVLAQPWVMIGSDASVRAPTGPLSHDHPHPRTYGTFPRFLRMALDGRTVPLPEAIRKATALPAETFGLRDRGLLSKGKKADIVVFQPDRLRDRSDFARPHQLSEGVDDLFVNGEAVLASGKPTGCRPGRFL